MLAAAVAASVEQRPPRAAVADLHQVGVRPQRGRVVGVAVPGE
ncbi:hypothetical protein [Allokutzneria multivorans]